MKLGSVSHHAAKLDPPPRTSSTTTTTTRMMEVDCNMQSPPPTFRPVGLTVKRPRSPGSPTQERLTVRASRLWEGSADRAALVEAAVTCIDRCGGAGWAPHVHSIGRGGAPGRLGETGEGALDYEPAVGHGWVPVSVGGGPCCGSRPGRRTHGAPPLVMRPLRIKTRHVYTGC